MLHPVAHQDVSVADKADFGHTGKVQHEIPTGHARPIRYVASTVDSTNGVEGKELRPEVNNKWALNKVWLRAESR